MKTYNTERLKAIMEKLQVEAVIATTRENIQYLTGFCPVSKMLKPYMHSCFAVVTKENPSIVNIVHFLGELDQVLDAKCDLGVVYGYGTFYKEYDEKLAPSLNKNEKYLRSLMSNNTMYTNPIESLDKLLINIGLSGKRVGIDVQDNALEQSLNSKIIYNSEIFYYPRKVKTDFEIQMLTESARCNEAAIQFVLSKLYLGISEKEIVSLFNMSVAQIGGIPEITMIKIGREAVFGQCFPREDVKLAKGDVLWFDSNARYKGYWSDIARTYIINKNNKAFEIYHNLRGGMLEAKKHVKAGMSGKDVFNLTMSYINSNRFEAYRRHHVGHGIGLESYENPVLSKNNDYVIEDGSVISIETPYYEFALGAVHLEDPILITQEENIFLTKNPIPENIIINL